MSNRLRNYAFTMDDIAQELGLSKSTVSRALSNSGRISIETKDRVRECARIHGFKPNFVAKALAGKKTLNIAVVMPFEANATQMMFFHECLSGIVSASSKKGYSVLVCMTENNDNEILKTAIDDGKVDAVILTQLKHDDKNVAFLKKTGFPFVVIGSGADDSVVHVDSKMKESCSDFTLLCAKNLSDEAQVLFVCGSLDVEANNNRLSGFLSGMERIKEKSLQYAVCTEVSDLSDEISLKNWDLVLCSDDVVCMQVLDVLKKKETEIGSEMQIASFHDSILLEIHSPGISAVKVDAFALGEKSSELSLRLADGEECETVNYVDCSFVMRESTRV